MVGVDTNVLVRLLTGDDPAQAARARRLFEQETIFIARTVLLETEWVVRVLYERGPASVIAALRALLSLEQVRCEDEQAVQRALDWAEAGMDLADALHLASSQAPRFMTFDRALIRRARRLATAPEAAPLP